MNGVFLAIGALLPICLAGGALLGYAAVRFRVQGDPVAEQVNALLPQTQCGQCGYPGCKPYAERSPPATRSTSARRAAKRPSAPSPTCSTWSPSCSTPPRKPRRG